MNEIELLKEINKNAKTGIDGINYTLDKVQNDELKNLLYKEKSEYENIYNRAKEILIQNDEKIEDTKPIQKAMAWMGVELNTLTNKSNSQIAELLIQGNDMGIIKGTKILNNMTFKNTEIENLLKDFIRLQEKNIDNLKKYL